MMTIEEQIDQLSNLESQERTFGNHEAAADALEIRVTMEKLNDVLIAAKYLLDGYICLDEFDNPSYDREGADKLEVAIAAVEKEGE